jgi:hypothetical protein
MNVRSIAGQKYSSVAVGSGLPCLVSPAGYEEIEQVFASSFDMRDEVIGQRIG